MKCVCVPGLKENMRQAELNNWSLDLGQMADLCSSINHFFSATGVIPPQGAAQPPHQAPHQPPPAPHPRQHISTGQSRPVCSPACARYRESL